MVEVRREEVGGIAMRPGPLLTSTSLPSTFYHPSASLHEPNPAMSDAVVPSAKTGSERLVSLDVFRGLTIAGMLLVNNPGTWDAIYPPLEHAPSHAWPPTDLILPFFVFMVG